MRPARVSAIAVRIVKQFRHDKRTVALIAIVPLVVMALIGYLIGDAGKEPLPVAVVNLDPPVPQFGQRLTGLVNTLPHPEQMWKAEEDSSQPANGGCARSSNVTIGISNSASRRSIT